MSALRRSPRLASIRVRQEQVALIRRTLEDRLALLDQAHALKSGWVDKMLREFTETQEALLDTPIMKLYLRPTIYTRKAITSLRVNYHYSTHAIRDKDIDALEEAYIDMLLLVNSIRG
jgi:hypothetical protein